jgi:N-methylhydantoinase A
VGFLSAPIAYEIIRSLYMRGEAFDIKQVRRLFTGMESEARKVVQAGAPGVKLDEQRLAFMRYAGQGHEIEIPLPTGKLGPGLGKEIHRRFDRLYQQQYGRTIPNVDVEIINWAFIASTPVAATRKHGPPRTRRQPKPERQRKIYWGQSRKTLTLPCYRREALQPGDFLKGPALITETQTTTLVGPGFNAAIDRVGNIVLTSDYRPRGKSNAR